MWAIFLNCFLYFINTNWLHSRYKETDILTIFSLFFVHCNDKNINVSTFHHPFLTILLYSESLESNLKNIPLCSFDFDVSFDVTIKTPTIQNVKPFLFYWQPIYDAFGTVFSHIFSLHFIGCCHNFLVWLIVSHIKRDSKINIYKEENRYKINQFYRYIQICILLIYK